MLNRIGVPALIAASLLSAIIGGAVTYGLIAPKDPETIKTRQAQEQEKLLNDNEQKVSKVVKNLFLARQLNKGKIIINPKVLDSGETSIALTSSGHAHIVQEPNQYRSSKNIHYTSWKYEVFKDEMYGTISRTASIGNLIEYTGNMREPFMLTLNIRCEDKDNTCEMFFASQFGFDPTITGIINQTKFNIQLDGKNIESFALNLGEGYRYAIATNKLHRYLYDNLESAKVLRVELWSGSNAQFEFDLSGFEWKKFNSLSLEESVSKLKT